MEIVFMTKEEDAKLFCGIMMLAHFYTWNFFYERFGVEEFPWSRAFFDDITIRHCYGKEAKEDTTTISNPDGDPFGESITIKEILEDQIFDKIKLFK